MKIVLFGDSVFAGWGLAQTEGIAARLSERMGDGDTVIAAGIPDETSASGLARVGAIEGDFVLVNFGLNDAMNGVPYETVVANLRAIVERLDRPALLVEALVPPDSHWPTRTDLTGAVCEAADGAPFVPDILAQLAWAGRLQADGLHPDAAGAALVANELAAAIDHWRTT